MKAVDFPLDHVLIHKRARGQVAPSYRVERSIATKSTIEVYSDQILIALISTTEKSATVNIKDHSRLTSAHQLATLAWLQRHRYNVSTVKGDLKQT